MGSYKGIDTGRDWASLADEIALLRLVLEQTLDYIANEKIPRQNIAGPIRAALNKLV